MRRLYNVDLFFRLISRAHRKLAANLAEHLNTDDEKQNMDDKEH